MVLKLDIYTIFLFTIKNLRTIIRGGSGGGKKHKKSPTKNKKQNKTEVILVPLFPSSIVTGIAEDTEDRKQVDQFP